MAPSDNPAAVVDPDDIPVQVTRIGRSGSTIPIIIAFCVGCALSISAYILTSRVDHNAQHDGLVHAADIRFNQIEKRIDGTISVLKSIAGLYAASRDVERKEFRAFVDTLGEHSAVQALEWIPRVSRAQRAAFEQAARQEGFAEFTFSERQSQGQMVAAGLREAYFPVYFVEPYAGNEAALGFDLGSSVARLEALNQARDNGQMVATSRITLVQETGDQYGFLVFHPIYRSGTPRSTLAQRRANLIGFGLGVFRIGDLVTEAMVGNSPSQTPLAIQILDQSAPEKSRRLYPKSAGLDDGAAARLDEDTTRLLDVAGRKWLLVATPAGGRLPFLWRPWAVLLTGLLFTALATLYLRLITSRAKVIERLVDERTARLTRVNNELEVQVAKRKQAQDALKRRAEELARSNAELERFAAVASHDLQEPLRKVQAFGDRLSTKYSEVLDEKGRDYVSRMQNATSRMQSLIEDLLSISRIATKGAPFVPVDLNAVGREVLADLEVRIQETGAEVEISALPTIEADPTQMRQLFQNLIGNALKYRRSDAVPRVEVSIGLENVQNGQTNGTLLETCRILFEDNGIGFEQDYADRIFGIFQRLHGRSEYDGTGIGLAICRRIAERHGGNIEARGRPGEGATFAVTVPTTQAHRGDA